MKWTPNYSIACQIQKRILVHMNDDKLSHKDLAALTSAWNTLEERKRILRMKPKPRSIDVNPTAKKAAAPVFTE